MKISPEILESAMDHADIIVLICDIDGKTVWANKGYFKKTGFSAEETLGLRPPELPVCKLIAPSIHIENIKQLTAGKHVNQELQLITRSGEAFWVKATLQPFQSEMDEPGGFVFTGTDVSEEIKVRSHFSAYVKNTTAGHAVINAEGQFIECTDEAARLLGTTRQEILDYTREAPDTAYPGTKKTLYTTDGKIAPRDHYPGYQTLRSGKPARNAVFGIRKDDGKFRWLMFNTEPSLIDGQRCVISSFIDITAQRALDEANQKRVRLSAAVSRVQATYISATNKRAAFDQMVEELMELTDSQYGIIGDVLTDRKGQPWLKSRAITDTSWDEATRTSYTQNFKNGMEFRNLKSLHGAILTSRKTVLVNAVNTENENEQDFDSFLGIPLFHGGQMIAIAAIANRQEDYSEELVEDIQPLLDTIARLVVASQHDETRAELEQKAEKSQESFNAALIVADAAAWEYSTQTDLVKYSPTLPDIMDFLPTDFLTQKELFDLIHPDDRAQAQTYVDAHMLQNFPIDFEHRVATRDHSERWVRTTAQAQYNEDGQFSGMVGLVQNINSRRNRETALKKALKEAETATMAKSSFLATMSHEIRTPMNGVLSLVDVVLDSPLDEEQREHLQTVKQSAHSLMRLLNDILDVSKIETGKMGLEFEPISMQSTLDQITSLWEGSITAKGLAFDIERAPDLTDQSMGDANRIRQVLSNLISNAIKFTEKGLVKLSVSSHKSDDRVTYYFEVTDSGIGINADQVDTLFEKFSQADQSISRRFGGSGLGLAICKDLITLMNGSISVSSTIEEGTTFKFDITCALPENDAEARKKKAAVTAPKPRGVHTYPSKILVVEDNPTNRIVIKALLKNKGIDISWAENGEDACQAASTTKYDAILMDIQMPKMDGVTATTIIRGKDWPSSQTPIIALTANAMAGDEERYLQAGMNGYVSKPIDPDELFNSLATAAKGIPN